MAETAVASPIKSDHHNTRKNKKPLMEKRRRARINSCLAQLKSLVLQAIKKDSSQFSKLEKADILELTVKHLRALQRQQAAGVMTSDPNVVSKYRAGFNECAKEVMRYMGSVRDVTDTVKERVLGHLAGCLQVVNHVTPQQALQEQAMKPLHVHIPGQTPLGQASLAQALAPSTVIMSTQPAMPAPASFTPSPVGSAAPVTFTPSPVTFTPSPTGSASSDSRLSASPVHSLSLASSGAPTALTHSQHSVSGTYKILPTSACPGGAVALYVGGGSGGRGEGVSVDAVPLYSVPLPQSDGAVTAFVPPASSCTASATVSLQHTVPHSQHHTVPHSHSHHHSASQAHHNTSQAHCVTSPDLDCGRVSSVSTVRADYTSLTTSLPVDLRQKGKGRSDFADSRLPVPLAPCNRQSLADEKLWRPW